MRAYALAVAIALVGRSACVHCGDAISLWRGECDRTASGCYRPGFVVMVCEACNNGAGQTDNLDRARYAADVLAASLTVTVPSATESLRAYRAGTDVTATIRQSPYWRG